MAERDPELPPAEEVIVEKTVLGKRYKARPPAVQASNLKVAANLGVDEERQVSVTAGDANLTMPSVAFLQHGHGGAVWIENVISQGFGVVGLSTKEACHPNCGGRYLVADLRSASTISTADMGWVSFEPETWAEQRPARGAAVPVGAFPPWAIAATAVAGVLAVGYLLFRQPGPAAAEVTS